MYFISDFDYKAVAKYLKRNLKELSNLPYEQMKDELFANHVITKEEMETIKTKATTKQKMSHLIVDILIVSLQNKFPNKYLDFVYVMENNEDQLLQAKGKEIKATNIKRKLIFSDMCIYAIELCRSRPNLL